MIGYREQAEENGYCAPMIRQFHATFRLTGKRQFSGNSAGNSGYPSNSLNHFCP